jgi:hypothetical protein
MKPLHKTALSAEHQRSGSDLSSSTIAEMTVVADLVGSKDYLNLKSAYAGSHFTKKCVGGGGGSDHGVACSLQST